MAKSAIKMRCLTDRDVGSIVGLWNGVLEREKPSWWAGQADDVRLSAEAFDQAASNPHFAWEDSLVAESSGRIVGFAWGDSCPLQECVEEQNTSAELKGIVVEPAFRRWGIGTRLLKGVESRAQTQGKTQMYVEADVLVESSEYKFLLAHKYRPEGFEMVLELDLANLRTNEKAIGYRRKLEQEGVEFRDYQAADFDVLAVFVQETAPEWWPRYQREIRNGRMDSLLLACCGDRIVGSMEVKIWEVRGEKRTGGGPLVHPGFRRRGIGTVLMHLWGEKVKALGACRSVIATGTKPEPENPALRLYLAMGYQKRGEFCEDLAKDLRL